MLRTVLTRAASEFDRAVNSAFIYAARRRAGKKGPESLGHADRIRALDDIQRLYNRPEHFEDPGHLFPTPLAVDPRLARVRPLEAGRDGAPGDVVDATWLSDFTPFCADVAEKYLAFGQNRTAAARLFLHADRPRPAVILIHGYRCGQYALEERAWPIRWLFGRGLDVALAVLPFHAVRALRGEPPRFPSNDPRITNEGFRQAVFDIRALSRFLIDRGAPSVGVMGMSLGGYTTSLLATLDASLSFAVPIIPLASIADIARESGRFVGDAEQRRAQHEALDAAHRAVSPFARKARIPGDRILVVGAAGDRITPIDHAERLAAHFGAPLETMHGGHLLQFGRSDAFRAIGRLLGRHGLFSEPR
jgi:dienelactone hydrolase